MSTIEKLVTNQRADIKAKAPRGQINLAQERSIELELRKREDKMVTKVEEVKNLVALGIKVPNEAFPKIKQLAPKRWSER